jgi:hypothetical protein
MVGGRGVIYVLCVGALGSLKWRHDNLSSQSVRARQGHVAARRVTLDLLASDDYPLLSPVTGRARRGRTSPCLVRCLSSAETFSPGSLEHHSAQG